MKPTEFKQVLIIWNPASTNSRRINKRLKELYSIFDPEIITTIETSPDGREANRKLVLKHKDKLGPKTLVCIGAGDGTVNLVAETLLSNPSLSDIMRSSVILPLWGGNANDLGNMLNGYSIFTPLEEIFNQGKIIDIKPLKVTLRHKGQKDVRIAACYASFGATAYSAHRINNPPHRHNSLRNIPVLRVFRETYTVIRAFVDVPIFTTSDKNSEQKTKMYEYAFINGSRIAKIERMPVKLTENKFLVGKIYEKQLIVGLYILQIFRKRKGGYLTGEKQEFTIHRPTWLQLDGEVIEISPQTTVQVELNEYPFRALSKRLRHSS
jgi:diacylglycerol kinase family enzyme